MVNRVELSDTVSGVLGDSARIKYDEQGQPLLKAHDQDGAGILDSPLSAYLVESLVPLVNVTSKARARGAAATAMSARVGVE